MSLSTLLEAAKYLDYLDSNSHRQEQRTASQQQQQNTTQPLSQQFQTQQATVSQPTSVKKSTRRQRSSRKDAANTMVAMSLPASTNPMQLHQGVPIPLAGNTDLHHQAASLSSSFTTGSPLSSFASTALLCSKASGVTSNSSSASSSLSSSDSSSSCGEVLMGDNDLNQPGAISNVGPTSSQHHSHNLTHQLQSKFETQPTLVHRFSTSSSAGSGNEANQSFARYIAATSAGPQLVTMTTSSAGGITSASAPIDGRIRAGHVIQAATNNSAASHLMSTTGTSFDSRNFSIATTSGLQRDGQTFSLASSNNHHQFIGSDNHLSGSPLIMARVQPMILNSISPSAHHHHHQMGGGGSGVMAFQPATASSPTSSSSSYSRHRELHKTLEKNRRAHLRHCFELLKAELPASECVDKKTSHINIIKSAIRYVLALRQQGCENDNELQRLTKIKNELTERLSRIRNDQQQQRLQQQSQSSLATSGSNNNNNNNTIEQMAVKQEQQQPPAAEQQLSFLLSQSKID